ncbi:TonB-dependent receptor [Labrys neptuniae]|uniref:TonB-dependent receptor n=1 Tax=Labrys neptuniae TaxID=376174 RepID=UPI002891DC6B|nr:TonB-dependent receptor [Labrys neptuniae]MDT3376238.1 TonB-dependent receptor [Labrys neptuniae]
MDGRRSGHNKGCGFGGLTRIALLGSVSIGMVLASAWCGGTAYAQTSQQGSIRLDIRQQDLGPALTRFADQAGLRLLFASSLVANRTSPALSGSYTREQALSRLLAGTGLSYSFTSANTVTISGRAAGTAAPLADDGSLVLDVITVTAGQGGNQQEAPYETPAPTAYISEKAIERFRGSSPADIFRGTPGVTSGEARNGAGAIDVNIRGMQGMGRVAVTVDGAENAVTVYQGYQGTSNRTFVDPDLLGGIDITKGSDVTSNGIAGTVAMRTLDAADIVQDGKNYGVRVRGGFGTNTSSPKAGAVAGYQWPYASWASPVATPSPTGMDRPALLSPTSGSGSVVAAVKEENFDLIAGYAYRKQGNYHAGTNGPSAYPIHLGPRRVCSTPTYCQNYTDYIDNGGIANYRAGEEVLNTQLETQSWIAKGTVRFGDGHSVQLGYNGFRSEAGDLLASRLTNDRGQAVQQAQTTGTSVDSVTLRYRWKPEDNDLINLKTNLWWSKLEMRNPLRAGYRPPKPGDFRSGSDTDMWGAEITNTSKFQLTYGSADLTYGLSYRGEDTRPSRGTKEAETWLDLRDGIRHEAAGFAKAAWRPVDWLTLNGGLRYQYFWSEDRNAPELVRPDYTYDTRLAKGGISPSIGVTVEPFDGTQFYVNYSNAMRLPSIMESVSAFTMNVNSHLKPERSSNWEIGTNLRREGLLSANDRGMLKLGYFDWTVDDYIARQWYTFPNGVSGMRIFNIDRAHFSGLELSGRYELGGFTADLAANYYTNVEFCRTAGTCENKSLYADYSTNHIPPRYSLALTLSQKLMDDALTVGGRISHVGARAIGHGDVTAQGASQFIALVDWKRHTLVDVFAEYKFSKNLTGSVRVENLTDQYYVDPLSLVQQPGPGRTFYASLTATF